MPPPVQHLLSVLIICGQMTLAQVMVAGAAGPPLGPLATARLIAAPRVSPDGAWTIGVVVTLQPKAITYWRNPGEAGVPPTFDFTASTNVASASVAYPAPKRIREGDIDANGYDGEVVFPVRIAPAERTAPIRVRLKLDYATCERICLPAHADLALELPAPAQSIDAARLDRAFQSIPRVLDAIAAAGVADVAFEPLDGGSAWRVTPKAGWMGAELFAEGPDGFFFVTTREGGGYRISVAEHPAGRSVPDAIRFTLVGPADAVEFTGPHG